MGHESLLRSRAISCRFCCCCCLQLGTLALEVITYLRQQLNVQEDSPLVIKPSDGEFMNPGCCYSL